jgi:hypothetical protein
VFLLFFMVPWISVWTSDHLWGLGKSL